MAAAKGSKKTMAKRKAAYTASKPQAKKKGLRRLATALRGASPLAGRRQRPHIVRAGSRCAGLVLGQAPPAPRSSLPRGWRPLAGPTEQRLAKLAGMKSPADFWREFDRGNVLSWYPGLKGRTTNTDTAKGYKLHQSDGDVFPMEDAGRAAGRLNISGYKYVILLGNNVAKAFRASAGLLEAERRGSSTLLTFPHPSGVSHFWNDPSNVQKASRVLKSALRAMRRRRVA